MRYAIIENNIVTNIIILRDINSQDFPEAIALLDRPVSIGDSYLDGKFYRDDKEVLTISEENEILRNSLQTLGVEMEDVNES